MVPWHVCVSTVSLYTFFLHIGNTHLLEFSPCHVLSYPEFVSGLNAERAEDDNVAYMAQFDQLDMGLDFTPYDDPPPPYSSPKPPRVPMGEAPPPYEEALQSPGNNNVGETTRDVTGDALPPTRENGTVEDDAIETTMPQDGRSWDNHSEAGFRQPSRSSSQTGGAVDESPIDDNHCPEYGVAMVTSESSECGSPSQIIVRMHNNIPCTSVVEQQESPRAVHQDNEVDMAQNCQSPSHVANRTRPPFAPQSSKLDATRTTTCLHGTPRKHKDDRCERTSAVDNCCVGRNSPDVGPSIERRLSSLRNSPDLDDEVRDVQSIHSAIHLTGRRKDNAGCQGNGFHGIDRGCNRQPLGVQVFSAQEIADAAKSLRPRRSLPPTDLVLPERHQAETCATDGATCSGAAQLEGARDGPRSTSEDSYPSEGACGGADIHPSPGHLRSGVSAASGNKMGARCPGGDAVNCQPVIISPSDSPVRQSPVFVRSSSVTSQFSVCSETGERRQYGTQPIGWSMPFAGVHSYDNHPAPTDTRFETNNLPERCVGGNLGRGDSPLRQECPEDSVDNQFDLRRTRQSGAGRYGSDIQVDPRTSQHARLDEYACASNEPRMHGGNIAGRDQSINKVGSNTESRDSGMIRSKVTAAPVQAKVMPLTRLIYRDPCGLGDDTDSGNAASVSSVPSCYDISGSSDHDTMPVVTRSPLGASPSRGCIDASRRAKRLSSGAGFSPSGAGCGVDNRTPPEPGFHHEKTTLRQLKKKRRPHSSPAHPADLARLDLDNSQQHDKNKNLAVSPGRGHRRTPKDQLDNSATYKEYGFIDTPESSMIHLANADLPKSLSKYLSLCKLQQSDDNANTDGQKGGATKHSQENSRERALPCNQKKRDSSASRQKKRRSQPVSGFNGINGGDMSMLRHDNVSCSPTRHKHSPRHYQN